MEKTDGSAEMIKYRTNRSFRTPGAVRGKSTYFQTASGCFFENCFYSSVLAHFSHTHTLDIWIKYIYIYLE